MDGRAPTGTCLFVQVLGGLQDIPGWHSFEAFGGVAMCGAVSCSGAVPVGALAERAPERPLVAHLAAQEDGIFHSVSICLITILANPFFPFMRLRSYPRSSSALASDLALPAGICCASHHSFHEAKSWPVVVQANGPPSAVHSSSH